MNVEKADAVALENRAEAPKMDKTKWFDALDEFSHTSKEPGLIYVYLREAYPNMKSRLRSILRQHRCTRLEVIVKRLKHIYVFWSSVPLDFVLTNHSCCHCALQSSSAILPLEDRTSSRLLPPTDASYDYWWRVEAEPRASVTNHDYSLLACRFCIALYVI